MATHGDICDYLAREHDYHLCQDYLDRVLGVLSEWQPLHVPGGGVPQSYQRVNVAKIARVTVHQDRHGQWDYLVLAPTRRNEHPDYRDIRNTVPTQSEAMERADAAALQVGYRLHQAREPNEPEETIPRMQLLLEDPP